MSIPDPSVLFSASKRGRLGPAETSRWLPEETPVALDYDGVTHAVMMASPADLEDFAVGFSLAEGIIEALSDITDIRPVATDEGILLRISLVPERDAALVKRRRHLAGPTGCGLCGLDSLTEATRKPPTVRGSLALAQDEIIAAMDGLVAHQTLNAATHAVHAAGFWVRNEGIVAVREDVGRHNALDKLAGGLARSGQSGSSGIVLLTSRVSVEMVQKCAILGAPLLAAVSAPTALAVRLADECGITLIGVARADGFEIFTHPERVNAAKILV